MRKYCSCIMLLVLTVCLALSGTAETSSTDTCTHAWEAYDELHHGTSLYKAELVKADPDRHWYVGFYPAKVCTICGQGEYARGGSTGAYHAFKVVNYHFDDEEANVTIAWECDLCGYERAEMVTVQSILEGTNETCLLGAECHWQRTSRYMHEGVVLDGTMPAEWKDVPKEWFRAVIYDMETGRFLCTTRKYCIVCGRPSVNDKSPEYEAFHEKWSGLPIMTLEYFLNEGIPQNMPYRLIDELRSVQIAE